LGLAAFTAPTGLSYHSFFKIASQKMRETFAWGVPTGTGAQPTGENFSSKILGRLYTGGGLLLFSPD
jgi:hypothetical protein